MGEEGSQSASLDDLAGERQRSLDNILARVVSALSLILALSNRPCCYFVYCSATWTQGNRGMGSTSRIGELGVALATNPNS